MMQSVALCWKSHYFPRYLGSSWLQVLAQECVLQNASLAIWQDGYDPPSFLVHAFYIPMHCGVSWNILKLVTLRGAQVAKVKLGKLQALQRICHHICQPHNRSESLKDEKTQPCDGFLSVSLPMSSILNSFSLSVFINMLLSHVIPISPHLKHVTHRRSLRSMSFSHAYISVASFISPGWSHTWLSFRWTMVNQDEPGSNRHRQRSSNAATCSNYTELPSWSTILCKKEMLKPLSLLHVEHKSICLSPARVTCQFLKTNHAWDKLR